jgi:hypothetical protein
MDRSLPKHLPAVVEPDWWVPVFAGTAYLGGGRTGEHDQIRVPAQFFGKL